MEKSSSAFRTISEVADELDVPKHVLRFWEGKFTQLRPMKRGGGRRYYRPEDVDLLRGIRWLLYSDGFTIKGVQRILRDHGVKFVKECWRDGGAGVDPAAAGGVRLEIPNLAGEAASEARKGPRLGGRKSYDPQPAEMPGSAADRLAANETPRSVLRSVVRELEECRDVLRASATDAGVS